MILAIKSFFSKIETSFVKSCKGQEDFHNVIWYWGVAAYVVALFLIDKAVMLNQSIILDVIISLFTGLYFAWHLYITHKCKPKKTKLTKVEKKLAKQKARQQSLKNLIQKLFLQKSLSQWDSAIVITACDLYMITHFLSYVL